MNCFLITYDLLTASKDYEPLYAEIKKFSGWWHHLESVWIIVTSKSITEVSDSLKAMLDDKDSLLVVDITGKNRRGWLTKRAWDWLDGNNPVQGANSSCGH